MNFRNLKIILFSIAFVNLSFFANAKTVPESFADLAEKLMPSVVNISTTQTVVTNVNPFPFEFPPGSPFEDMFKEFGTPQKRKASALGSGFIIDEKGIVITNNHVIKGAEDIIVRVDDDEEYKAKVIGADPLSDIAVLKIESTEKFKAVKFGNSDEARIGDWVIAIGNPFGLGGTVTSGIVSARNRDLGMNRYEDFIQTDASINVGNSGGPLFDMNGDVIGINTAILGREGSIGIGFAIPINRAKRIVEELKNSGRVDRSYKTGLTVQPLTPRIALYMDLEISEGLIVVEVEQKSSADRSGIKNGDIITRVNGIIVKTTNEFRSIIEESDLRQGDRINVKLYRNGRYFNKKLILGRGGR